MRDNTLLSTPAAQPKLLITIREAAAMLSVCEKTIWNATQRGDLRAVRIGKSVRYAMPDLLSFIEAQKGGGAA